MNATNDDVIRYETRGQYNVTLGRQWRVLVDAVRKRQRKAEKRLRERNAKRSTSPKNEAP